MHRRVHSCLRNLHRCARPVKAVKLSIMTSVANKDLMKKLTPIVLVFLIPVPAICIWALNQQFGEAAFLQMSSLVAAGIGTLVWSIVLKGRVSPFTAIGAFFVGLIGGYCMLQFAVSQPQLMFYILMVFLCLSFGALGFRVGVHTEEFRKRMGWLAAGRVCCFVALLTMAANVGLDWQWLKQHQLMLIQLYLFVELLLFAYRTKTASGS
jgi:hypothetical protein